MKQCLLETYGIEAVGFIKITDKVYKVKTKDTFYCLKYVLDNQFEMTYEHIKTLGLTCFIEVIKNNDQRIVSRYNQMYFYIMPWIDNDLSIVKELKLKSFFETLAKVHNDTFFQYNVSKDYYLKQIDDIRKVIIERKYYYLEMMKSYESMCFRSPAGWMFILNYCRIEKSLDQALCYLSKYEDLVSCLDHVRVCIVYNNFNYEHIVMNQKKLISIDKTTIDICIYDIFSMYHHGSELLYDLDTVCMYYMDNVCLLPEEKMLLACILSIVPYMEIEKDEVKNVVKMTRILYYIDSVQALTNYLECN